MRIELEPYELPEALQFFRQSGGAEGERREGVLDRYRRFARGLGRGTARGDRRDVPTEQDAWMLTL